MKRAIFLDRDGVLIDHSGSVVPGARRALLRLKDAGFVLICVTNQPDVATGKIDRAVLDRVHKALMQVLPLDALFLCPHVDADKCECRKPKPGMLIEAAAQHDIDLPRSWMVGDRWRDIGAGAAAGCTTLLIGTGYGEPFPVKPQHRCADLDTAARLIMESA